MTWLTIAHTIFSKRFRRIGCASIALINLMAQAVAIASDGRTIAATASSSGQLPAASPDGAGDGPATCAKRYHAKLGSEILAKAQATLIIADQMRKPNPEMPGYWLFWDGSGIVARSPRQRRLLATPQIIVRGNRMCTRSILVRGGRIRCLKWKLIPPGYVPPQPVLPTVEPTQAIISEAERRIASRISSRVRRKGAYPELRDGTALYHVSQRTSDELISYARQPYRATICTGTTEMLNFYRHQLGPLKRKTRRAIQLQEEAHQAALATAGEYDKKLGNTISQRSGKTYSQVIRQMVTPLIDTVDYAKLPQDARPLVLLQSVRGLLSDERFLEIAEDKRGPLRKALRNIEFTVYARQNARRWKRLVASYEATFEAIRTAYEAECKCGN